MTMTVAQRAAMLADLNAEQFAPLDTASFPNFQEASAPESHDNRFAKHWTDTPLTASAAALRHFVSDPDADSLERVGNEIGHEGFRDEVRQRKGERIAQLFMQARPGYVASDENLDRVTATMAYNYLPPSDRNAPTRELIDRLIDTGAWDVQHLCAVYDALDNEGSLEVQTGEPRNLSESERLRVARLAQSGRPDQAIGFYLECALPDVEPSLELLNDPQYRAVCDSASWTVWETITTDYTPTASREAFLRRHCGQRPITLPLLDAAWAALKQREAGYERSAILGQIERPEKAQPVSGREIDALSDEAVDQLYHSSLRAYADQIRRSRPLV
jgi:hypothetical protein